MRPSFADVLDEALAAHPSPYGAAPLAPFTFVRVEPLYPRPSAPAPQPAARVPIWAAEAFRAARPVARALPRPARRLAMAERDALAALVQLGATIREDFTAAELQSAYRLLARRYHPDRHPGSSAVEKARLSRVFADLTEHYRRLLRASH